MAKPPSPATVDRLARLGRDWFAEVRAKVRAEAIAARSCDDSDTAGVAGADLLDWLLGDRDAGDGGGSDGGD